MSKFSRPLILSILFLLFYVLFRSVISITALSSTAVLEIDAEIDHDDRIGVYYSTGLGNVSFSQRKSVKTDIMKKNRRSRQKVFLNNNIVRKLRIDTGAQAGTVKIYRIVIDSFFGSKVEYSASEIYQHFQPNSSVELFRLDGDYVTISSSDPDPYLLLRETLVFQNALLKNVVPFFFSLVAVICVSSFSLTNFPAVSDIRNKKSSAGINYAVLDGFRGLAAILVLCEHSGVMVGVGALGVWIFFTLSGFLLAIPFIHTPRKVLSAAYLKTYVLRRILRIVPMYYCFITMYLLFTGHEMMAIRHYLFLQGDIHLWTIPQEMLFYLILPVIMFFGYFVARKNKVIFFIYIFILIIAANRYLTVDRLALYVYGKNMAFLVGIFLSGVFFSYLYHWLVTQDVYRRYAKSFLSSLASLTGCLLLIIMSAASAGWLDNLGTANDYPGRYGFLAGLIIFLILASEHTRVSKFFSFFPLRAVGVVGFSFYLLHPLVIWAIQGTLGYLLNYRPGGLPVFLIAGVVTYVFAAITYTYIERPFLKINSR